MFVYLCLIFYNILHVFGTKIDANLELVQVVFRHGDRTPLADETRFIPQYNHTYEPWGIAQLTKEGMIQEYGIGKMLRERYNDFLPNMYRPRDVYAHSSHTDRTIASVQLVLAALYTPVGEQKWNDNLNWMPIPVHMHPQSLDILTHSRDCPGYMEKLEEFLDSEYIKSSKLDSVVRAVSKARKAPLDYGALFGLTNILKIRKHLKLPIPQWCTEEMLESMKEAGNVLLDALSYTDTLKRLNGGPFVRKFLENINNSNSKKDKRKIFLYSAHDKTLHAYMRAHNHTAYGNPVYGSAVIIEKYRNKENQSFVKMLYWTGEPKQLHTLKLDNCSEMCPLEVYSEIIKPSLPSDDEMLCLFVNKGPKDLEQSLKDDPKKLDFY